MQTTGFLALIGAALVNPGRTAAQDPSTPPFNPHVENPAYPAVAARHPRVLFDTAHFNNTHTPTGTYRGFAELIRNDGYIVTANTGKIDSGALTGYDIFVLATPQPFQDSLVNWGDSSITATNWTNPALTDEECNAIVAWVQGGGALLLVTGHTPRAFWSAQLGGYFGVDVHNSYAADSVNSEQPNETVPRGAWIVYSRENGLLPDHPLTSGRWSTERVRRVRVNGSASLSGPPGSYAFLRLGSSAYEWIYYDFSFRRGARFRVAGAAGRSQGLTLRHGKGRVVVLAPSGLFTERLIGRPDTDHRQLALNVLHWLSGLTDP